MDVPRVSAADALRQVADGAALLDIREPYEWATGHAPEAVHVPLGSLMGTALPAWERPVMVICRSGNRSQPATLVLRARGLDAYSVDGGMIDWAALGGEVVTASGAVGSVA